MPKRQGRAQRLANGSGGGASSEVMADGSEVGAQAEVSISQPTLSTEVDAKDAGSEGVTVTQDSDTSAKRARPANPEGNGGVKTRTVTHYQCVGQGPTRVFYVWVKGQNEWVMPSIVITPHQMGKLLEDEDNDRRTRTDAACTEDVVAEVTEVIHAYNVETMKYEYVKWTDTVARPRFLARVAQGMPDAEGLWF